VPKRKSKSETGRNGRVDEAGEETFPASDAPVYAGGGARIGGPMHVEPVKPKRKPAARAKRKRKRK
jgi:hypothetical protein